MENYLAKVPQGGLPFIERDTLAQILGEIKESSKAKRKASTPKKSRKERQGKGGQTFTYIEVDYVYSWLDTHYPGWSSNVIPDSYHTVGNHVHIAVALSVMEASGVPRTITRFGAKEAIPKANGSLVEHPYLKSAESDALKRCAVALGCAADIYGKGNEESEMQICDAADILWFCSNIPAILSAIPPEKIHNIPKQLTALQNCKLTKETLISQYAKLNIPLSA